MGVGTSTDPLFDRAQQLIRQLTARLRQETEAEGVPPVGPGPAAQVADSALPRPAVQSPRRRPVSFDSVLARSAHAQAAIGRVPRARFDARQRAARSSPADRPRLRNPRPARAMPQG